MKTLPKEVFQQLRRWVHLYASNLEIAQWRYHFEGGSAEDVLEALSFYQNEDGGFGHGVGDHDNMSPESSPVAFLWGACGIMKDMGCGPEHPMTRGVIRWFEQCPYVTERGVCFAVPSNSHYPCRPWFIYTEEPRFPGDWLPEHNISADFVAFAFENCAEGSALYAKAAKIVDYRLANILPALPRVLQWDRSIWQGLEPHDICKLIALAEKFGRKTHEECQTLYGQLLDILREYALPETYQSLEKRIKYGDNVPLPEDLDDIINRLSSGQPWSKNGLVCEDPEKKYDEVFNLGALWWSIKGAIGGLKTLKEHGRLEI